ncbi:MAG: hypothetical protein QOK37_355 [Thermoanaerobaculia bacterium]|nr:hypothetical protein [Thermoanaerobaculia bacterium]
MHKRLIAVLFSIVLIPSALFAADVASLAAAHANPTLGAAAKVERATIHISSITIELTSGVAAPVLIGADPIGLFFNGDGHYVYRSSDPVEKSLVLFEAKKMGRDARKETDGSVTIRGDFKQLFLRGSGIELPPLKGETTDAALQQTFQRHREHFAKARSNPASHLLIRQQLDAASSPVAVAEFGGRDDVYTLDSIETKSETFTALITRASDAMIPAEIRHALFAKTISEQPLGRKHGAFVQPRFLLVNVDSTIISGDKESAKLTIVETIVARGTAQSAFRFDLLAGMWDSDGRLRKLSVDSVTDQAGHKLPFHLENDSILVGTAQPLAPDAEMTIRFDISGNFLVRPDGDNYWLLGLEPWFPQPSLNGQYYTAHSIVKVKKPWISFATGDTVSRSEEGEFNVLETKVEKPIQFNAVIAGKYSFVEDKHDDITIRVATYAKKNDRATTQLPKLAYKIIKFYEPFLGPFPFKELNIIEINDLGWGQAPAQMMFITKEAFAPLLQDENRAYSKGINQRFAHEIAHQYWGSVIKMGGDEEQWLTEAFAEYCSALVVKEIEGQRGYDAMLDSWRNDAKEATDIAPIPLANRVDIPGDPVKEYEIRTGLLYAKGAWLLAVLRKQMGDEKLLLTLRNIQGRYAWHFVTTTDVANLFKRIDGNDHQTFFDRYFWGTEMPEMPK